MDTAVEEGVREPDEVVELLTVTARGEEVHAGGEDRPRDRPAEAEMRAGPGEHRGCRRRLQAQANVDIGAARTRRDGA
jgi:hypothetical protein